MNKNIFKILTLIVFISIIGNAKSYWERVDVPAQYSSIHFLDVKFLPNDLNYGWACGYEGVIIRTTDGGKTWAGVKSGMGEQFESINFVDKLHGFVSGAIPGQGMDGNLYKTSDGGKTWKKITPPGSSGNITLWGNYFLDTQIGMAVGGDCNTGSQIFFKTTDAGASWSSDVESAYQSKLADVILYSPTGLGYAAGSGIIWRSVNGGASWDIFSKTGSNDWHEDFAINNKSILVSYAVSCDGSLSVGTGLGGARMSTDMGLTWKNYQTPGSMFGATLIDDKRGWVCGLGGYVYYTSDGGDSWTLRNCGIPSGVDLDNLWNDGKDALWMTGRGMLFKWIESTPPKTEIEALTPVKVCQGDTVVLNCKNDFKYYTWSTGASTKSIKVFKTGYYGVVGKNHQCEIGTPDSIYVEVAPYQKPTITTTAPKPLCDGDSVEISTNSIYASYLWNTGDTTYKIKVGKSGTYSVKVTNSLGCSGKDSVKVTFNPRPNPHIFASRTSACIGDYVYLSLSEKYANYKWYVDGKLISSDAQISVNQPGLYKAIVANASGCTAEDTVTIKFRLDTNALAFDNFQTDYILDLGTGTYENINCKKLTIKNRSSKATVVDNVVMLYKFAFSIPQGVFPIVIQPGDSFGLEVCYSPTKFEVQRDTIIIPDACSDHVIPLVCKGYPQNYTAESNCGVFVKLTGYDVQKGTRFVANSPYPNPSTGKTKALVSAFAKTLDVYNPQAQVFDLYGEKVMDCPVLNETIEYDPDGVYIYGYVDMETSLLKSGVYFLVVSNEGQTYRYKILVK